MKTQRRAPSPTGGRATKTYHLAIPSRLRHPALPSLVFQTFEDLTTLRRHCMEEVESARHDAYRYRTLLVRPAQSRLRRWRRMLTSVTRCWCVLDDLVRTNRLVATRCHEVYRALLGIQVAWPRIEGPAYCSPLIAQTLDHVRQLLIHHAQRHGHQSRVSS
ncbi:MAG: hypothetical protein IPP12_21085 [Nitrospira sp.]|nr:hypothetical protein [Nitrospira sp.]